MRDGRRGGKEEAGERRRGRGGGRGENIRRNRFIDMRVRTTVVLVLRCEKTPSNRPLNNNPFHIITHLIYVLREVSEADDEGAGGGT